MTPFIFSFGTWLGKGTLAFTATKEKVGYAMKWVVHKKNHGIIVAKHSVELDGVNDVLINHYQFYEFKEDTFLVNMENAISGKTSGQGIYTDKKVGWELRGHTEFEGYEMYHLQADGTFVLQGEYTSFDQYRSEIRGTLWKKI